MNPLLVTMRGPGEIRIDELSNFEAGIAFLTLVNDLNPGVTFGELGRALDDPETMAGLWSKLKKAASSVKNGVGDVLKSTADYVGGVAGSAVRLVTDEKVIDGASRLGTAYATGGGSEAVKGVLGGGSAADQVIDFISNLGNTFKTQTAPMTQSGMFNAGSLPWIIGGGALLVLLFGRGGRR